MVQVEILKTQKGPRNLYSDLAAVFRFKTRLDSEAFEDNSKLISKVPPIILLSLFPFLTLSILTVEKKK